MKSEKNNLKEKSRFMLPIAVFFLFTLVIYGPLGLYLPNAQELWFRMKDVLIAVGSVTAALFVCLMAAALLLPRRLSEVFTKLVFGGTLGLYLQGNLMNISYGSGVLDGTAVQWEHYTKYAVVNTAVWCLCIALPFLLDYIAKHFAREKLNVKKVVVVISLFLTAVQIPALVVQLINYQPYQQNLTVSAEGIYDLSEKENVILFVVDTLDEKYYREFLETHPEYTEKLDGFVHYGNTLASGARTIVALPSMLTGIPFKREAVYTEYINHVWGEENPLKALHADGTDVRVYSEPVYFSEQVSEYVDNFTQQEEKVASYKIFTKKLYKLTLSKFLPHLLKKYVWFRTEEFGQARETGMAYRIDDAKFFDDYKEQRFSYTDQYDRAFRLYHLEGAHSPYILTADGEYGGKTSLEEQVAGNMNVLGMMLDDLKNSGHWDSSLIIITADHGDKNKAQQPFFLMKEKGASGEYRDSDIPLSLFDLPVLLYEYAGYAYGEQEFGMSMRELSGDMVRERHFFRNETGSSRLKIQEFVTASAADDYDAMTLVNEYEDDQGADTPYYLGTELSFTADATANRYGIEGFGKNTGFRTALVGPYAKMAVPIADVPESGSVHVHIGVWDRTKRRDTVLRANGAEVFHAEVSRDNASQGIDFDVPVEALQEADGVLTLEFSFPDIPEEQMEQPTNKRTQAISLMSMVIE